MTVPRFLAPLTGAAFFVVAAACLLCLAPGAIAAESWTVKAAMPTARSGHVAVELNGKIYLIGGHSGTAYVTGVDVYDPGTDKWSSVKSMANARYGLGAAVVGDKIIAAGGSGSSGALSSTEIYDPATDTWTAGPAMNSVRDRFSLVAFNGKAYAVGGASSGSALVSAVEEYDPTAGKWTAKAAIPTTRAYTGAAVVGNNIYAIGGFTGCSGCVLGTNEAYDPTTNSWTAKASLTTARLGIAVTTSSDGKVMAIGGDTYYSILGDVNVFDPATNAWANGVALPVGRREAAAVTVNGQVFVFGGMETGYKSTTTVYAFGTAATTPASFAITATASPSAGGTVACTPNPVSLGESSTCTATANSGYSFASWSGDCSGTNSTCTLSSVAANKTVTASFTASSTGSTAFDVTATASGGDDNLTLSATMTVASESVGQRGEVYVVANYGNYWFFNNNAGWVPQPAPYYAGTLAATLNIPIMSGVNLSSLGGLSVFAGHGSSLTEMVTSGHYKKVYTVSGSSAESVTVNPSNQAQTVTAAGVAVTVPGGLLSGQNALTVTRNASTASLPLPDADAKILGAYEITLGSSSSFNGHLTIEMPYDPALLDPSVPEGKNIWVSLWDTQAKQWTMPHVEVDAARKKLIIRTDHLCTMIYWTLMGYTYTPSSYGPFEVWYNPKHAVPRTDVAANYGMLDLANDTIAALMAARQAYKDAGFTPPNYQVKAIITDNPPSDYGSEMNGLSGNIILERAELVSLEKLRHDSAHELFHVFQNEYFNVYGMGTRMWWIEGTPDYAVSTIAWPGQVPYETLDQTYFSTSITDSDKPHAYQMAQFLRYLVEKKGIKFKSLWDAVAANSSTGDNGFPAFKAYIGSASSKTFDANWSDYVDYAMFGTATSGVMPGGIAAAGGIVVKDGATTGSKQVTAQSYSANVVKIGAQPTTGQQTRNITVAASGLASGTSVEIWQTANDNRAAAQLKTVLTSSQASASYALGANPTDGLYALVINTDSASQFVTVTASDAAAPIDTPPSTTFISMDLSWDAYGSLGPNAIDTKYFGSTYCGSPTETQCSYDASVGRLVISGNSIHAYYAYGGLKDTDCSGTVSGSTVSLSCTIKSVDVSNDTLTFTIAGTLNAQNTLSGLVTSGSYSKPGGSTKSVTVTVGSLKFH